MIHSTLLVIGAWSSGLTFLFVVVRSTMLRHRLRERMARDEPATTDLTSSLEPERGFKAWLYRAGHRSPLAASLFVVATVVAVIFAALLVFVIYRSGLLQKGKTGLAGMPGNVGDIFLPLLVLAPWLIGFVFAGMPWLKVRQNRRQRVLQVEQDLPLFLELLSTLSEAGLGLDAAIDRILGAQPVERVLHQELRQFQRDVLAGRPRVASLRRLSWRVDVPSLSVFISALVQAEQVGSGVATLLRRQADDLRDRRRERAIAFAMSLPVKLLFPLVICFLPGVFVATLGPTFYQFFQFADTVIQNRGLTR
jgi:tight adherence protein C